MSTFDKDEQF